MHELLTLIGPGLQLTSPLLFASLGGLLSYRAGIFNIALEGFMLVAAFAAVDVAAISHSVWIGVVGAMLAAGLLAGVMGVLVLSFRADEVIVGLALDTFALGLTSYLLRATTTSGYLNLPRGLPVVRAPLLAHVPVLGEMINGQNPLVFLSWILVAVVAWTLRNTLFGLRVRAVGESQLVAQAAGTPVLMTRMATFLLSGVLCGLGGAVLSLGSVHLFSMNMTSGSGFIAFAAVIFGNGVPVYVAAASLIFGFSQGFATLMEMNPAFSPQFVLMLPYLLAIAALFYANRRRRRRRRAVPPEPAPQAAEPAP